MSSEKRTHALRHQLHNDIDHHVATVSATIESHGVATDGDGLLDGFDLDGQRQAAREISQACSNLERLLDVLEDQVDVRGKDGKSSDVPDPRQERDQTRGEVRRLRAFAADDTTMETTSVADYSADPDVPDIFSETPYHDGANQMTTSVEKINHSISVLSGILSENPQWWNSAILVRRIKTHAIRTNYHARNTKAWGDHVRAHLLVSSTELNNTAHASHEAQFEIRRQLDLGAKRRENLENERVGLRDDIRELNMEKERLEEQARVLDNNLLKIAEERGIFNPDVQRTEAILILEKLTQSSRKSLESDCALVRSWLAHTQVPL